MSGFAFTEVIFTRMMMIFFSIAAMPVEEGGSLQIDVVTTQGVQSTLQIEREGDEYALYGAGNGEREELGQIEWSGEDGVFTHTAGEGESSMEDLSPLLGELEPGALADLETHSFRVESGDWMLLQRRGENLYLTANNQTFVVRKK